MNYEKLISAIDEEIDKLQQARKLFSGSEPSNPSRSNNRSKPAKRTTRKKRHLTREQREHLSKVQKERWAKSRSAQKKPTK